MILKFNSNIYDSKLKACSSGSTKGYNKSLAYDENGVAYLETEEFDQQAVIDSYEDTCSIERIIASHGLGDDLLLNQQQGAFLDEDAVNAIKSSQTMAQNNLNFELFKLYQAKEYDMTFEEFSKAVVCGKYDDIKEKTKEVSE